MDAEETWKLSVGELGTSTLAGRHFQKPTAVIRISLGLKLRKMSFNKALETPNEVITVLSSAEEETVLEKVSEIYNEIHNERTQQKENIEMTLRALSKLLTEKESAAKSSLNDKSSDELETLKSEKEATIEHIDKLEKNVRDLETNIRDKEVEVKDIQAKAAEIKNNSEQILPQTKYNFSLYTNVSHIRWDYDCGDDKVKGFIANLKDVKPFCLNKNENSKYDIAKYLWDLMDA